MEHSGRAAVLFAAWGRSVVAVLVLCSAAVARLVEVVPTAVSADTAVLRGTVMSAASSAHGNSMVMRMRSQFRVRSPLR